MVNPEKVEWVNELEDLIRSNSYMVFADFQGLTVEETRNLRRDLFEKDSRYCVVKNRLARQAFEAAEEEQVEVAETAPQEEAVEPDVELEDIDGVGPSKVEAMREAGYESVSELNQATEEELQEISGVGPALAEDLNQQVKELCGNGGADEPSASSGAEVEPIADRVDPMLKGNTAIVFNDSQVGAVTETVVDFEAEHEAFSIKGGMIEGEFLEPERVENIADLPSENELLTRLAMGVNAPLRNLVRFLKNPLQKFTDVLNQVKEQKED